MTTINQPPAGVPAAPPPPPPLPPRRHHRGRAALIVAGVSALAITGIAVAASQGGTTTTHRPAAASHPAASQPPPAAAPTLNASQVVFVAGMRDSFGPFGPAVHDSDLVGFGLSVCQTRSNGGSQASAETLARQSWTHVSATEAYGMARLAEKNLCPAWLPAKRWHVLASYSGGSDWTSPEFRLHNGSALKVIFGYSGNASLGSGDNFIAHLVSSSDWLSIANDIAASGSKVTYLYPDLSYGASPRYHLEVMATGSWWFTIKQKW